MGDIYKLEIQTRVDDVVSSFGLHYEQSAGGTDPAQGYDAGESWYAACATALRNLLATDVKIQGVAATKVYPVGGNRNWYPVDDVAGLASGTALPALTTFILNLRSSTGDLPRPGRVSISGCSKSTLENGQWDSDFIATQGTAFATAIKTIAAGGASNWAGSLVVLRKYEVVITNPGTPQETRELVKLDPPLPIPVDLVDGSATPGRQIRRKSRMFGV